MNITKTYKCSHCGNEKKVLVNHHMPELFERCTDQCMWEAKEGPLLYSANGEKTGFRKRLFKLKIQENFFFEEIMVKVQNLEEIGGPDTLQEYIAILEAVQADIAQRIKNAKQTKEELS